ncbi:hypothetical protein [uncultured Roseibium sp.]|uniref:hypothetical protein n=1 Tax=uncultured Roseibium sp. TaxID=1936171 RepID=UPI00260F6482|nr:hypothetical protein [uncultured Roseibium sp.]
MIHPTAAEDNFLAPLHRSLLTSCFLSGSVALIILPLHLALAGAPHAATIVVLAWMLSQWPIASFLSRTGELDTAIAFSSGLFASFVAVICMMTGGDASFALLWLLIPPVEAAFATNRKITVSITLYCCALFAFVQLFAGHVSQIVNLPPAARIAASVAALIYTGMLAARIALDRSRARDAVTAALDSRERIRSNVSEVLLEIGATGRLSILAGPLREVLGFAPSASDDDWLFQRLHVADRPQYLTRLADVRESENPASVKVRLRTGSNQPGEQGEAAYQVFELYLKPGQTLQSTDTAKPVILAIRTSPDDSEHGDLASRRAEQLRSGNVHWNVIEEAGASVQAQVSEIVDLARLVESQGKSLSAGSLNRTAKRIRSAGDQSAQSLSALLDLVPEKPDGADENYCRFDVADCLKHSCNLIRPLADRVNVSLEVDVAADLVDVMVNKKKFRQSLHIILSEMVETVGAGADVRVTIRPAPSGVNLELTAVNRQASVTWSSEGSRAVFDHAARLLEETGSRLKYLSALGHGETIVVLVPARFERSSAETPSNSETSPRSFAKTA